MKKKVSKEKSQNLLRESRFEAEARTTALKPLVEGQDVKVAEASIRKRYMNVKAIAESKKAKDEIRKYRKRASRPEITLSFDSLIKRTMLQKTRAKTTRYKTLKYKSLKKFEFTENADIPVILVIRNAEINPSRVESTALARIDLKKRGFCRLLNDTVINRELLWVVNRFVYYGKPSSRLIGDLLHSKAMVYENSKKGIPSCVPLKDNTIVEDRLGHLDILSVDEVVNVISSKEASQEVIESCLDILAPLEVGDIRDSYGAVRTGKILFGLKKSIEKLTRKLIGGNVD